MGALSLLNGDLLLWLCAAAAAGVRQHIITHMAA